MNYFDSAMLKIAKENSLFFDRDRKTIIASVFMLFVAAFFIMIALSFFGFNVGFLWVIMVTVFSCLLADVEPRVARKWCDFRGISWKKEAGEDAGKTADKGEQV